MNHNEAIYMEDVMENQYNAQLPLFSGMQQSPYDFFYDSGQGGFGEEEMIDPDKILLTESDVSFDSTVRDGAMYAQHAGMLNYGSEAMNGMNGGSRR